MLLLAACNTAEVRRRLFSPAGVRHHEGARRGPMCRSPTPRTGVRLLRVPPTRDRGIGLVGGARQESWLRATAPRPAGTAAGAPLAPAVVGAREATQLAANLGRRGVDPIESAGRRARPRRVAAASGSPRPSAARVATSWSVCPVAPLPRGSGRVRQRGLCPWRRGRQEQKTHSGPGSGFASGRRIDRPACGSGSPPLACRRGPRIRDPRRRIR